VDIAAQSRRLEAKGEVCLATMVVGWIEVVSRNGVEEKAFAL
jgi:hypothetical protein